jgi:hypothetical protein
MASFLPVVSLQQALRLSDSNLADPSSALVALHPAR